jgi:hypothetical protein
MIVRVSGGQARVEDQDDCTRLHVTTEQSAESTDSALRADGLGHLADPATAQLSVAQLRARASVLGVAPDWPDRWEAMLDYARGKGWLSPDGSLVQGHVESLPADR